MSSDANAYSADDFDGFSVFDRLNRLGSFKHVAEAEPFDVAVLDFRSGPGGSMSRVVAPGSTAPDLATCAVEVIALSDVSVALTLSTDVYGHGMA